MQDKLDALASTAKAANYLQPGPLMQSVLKQQSDTGRNLGLTKEASACLSPLFSLFSSFGGRPSRVCPLHSLHLVMPASAYPTP